MTQPINLLLAEDNEDDVILVREAFADAKLVNLVDVVPDGAEALAYLRGQGQYENAPKIGLLLLDINMPRKDGFEVLDELKTDPELASLPVVMLTTSHREADIVRSYSHGACTYILKPVSFEKFREVIKQFELYWTLVAALPGQS